MAQLGDLVRAKALLRRAARAFGPKEGVARAKRDDLEAMLLEDNAGGYYLPLVLRDVELRAREPGPSEAIQELAEELAATRRATTKRGGNAERGRDVDPTRD